MKAYGVCAVAFHEQKIILNILFIYLIYFSLLQYHNKNKYESITC